MANIGKLADVLSENWSARSLIPTFAFAGSGLLIWLFSHNNLDCFLYTIEKELSNGEKIIFWVVVGFFLLAIISGFMEWFTPLWIKLLEGYHWLDCLKNYKVKRLKKRLGLRPDRYRQLSVRREQGLLTTKEKSEYRKLEDELSNYPKNFKRLHPTFFGNILRASEEYPYINYGLDFYFVWSHLWLLMPESSQKEISNAFQLVNERARFVFWSELALLLWPVLPLLEVDANQRMNITSGYLVLITLVLSTLVTLLRIFNIEACSLLCLVLLCVWFAWPLIQSNLGQNFTTIPVAWITGIIIISILVVAVTYRGLCAAAKSYAEYHCAVFDLYRFELYKKLHWPQPTSPETEFFEGLRLTEYLRYNSIPPDMHYVPFDKSSEQLMEDLEFAHIIPETQEKLENIESVINSLCELGTITPPSPEKTVNSEEEMKFSKSFNRIETSGELLSEIIIKMRKK